MARSYGNYLLLSGLLENVPAYDTTLNRFAEYVLAPSVRVVAANCGTQLGSVESVGTALLGKTELATDRVIDEVRINELQQEGTYKVSIRTIDTCTASKGVCQYCYQAAYPEDPVPAIGDVIQVDTGTAPFFSYIADSYSGSLIGVRSLPAGRLPVRKELIDLSLTDAYIDTAYGKLKQYSGIPRDMLKYCGDVEDKLEKALFIIVLYSLFSSIRN